MNDHLPRSPDAVSFLPEVLAPAGNRACMEAAVRAGANAVYFGLPRFNARARADNFSEENLKETLDYLHEHGVRGYVTLNTLLFNEEIDPLKRSVEACAEAGVDAVIVQDLGVLSIARSIAPTMHVHASTQMTCTDAAACELAGELGAKRVILARELSLADIRAIAASTRVELEVFVHGALCIAYSGQCLTSEAIGGRSANRGACAQACRLPYELVVDGVLKDLGDRAYLLSPQDLEAASAVPELAAMGISSLKIEGRLKGPEYVAATTALYRAAVDALRSGSSAPSASRRDDALQQFSRGSDVGFFRGVNHQTLVEGRSSDHRGVLAGTLVGCVTERGKTFLDIALERPLSNGDGILVEGKRAGAGELGGRVWSLSENGKAVDEVSSGKRARVWLGPDKSVAQLPLGSRVFCTNSPKSQDRIRTMPEEKVRLSLDVRGKLGEPLTISATSERGHSATAATEALLGPARSKGLDEGLVREKVGQLGETPFILGDIRMRVDEGSYVSPAELKSVRRALVAALRSSSHRAHEIRAEALPTRAPLAEPPPTGLFVLCRNLEQARAAVSAGATGIMLDFLELTGTGAALRALKAESSTPIYVAPPRIRKPGEEKIDRFLRGLPADGFLIRSLGTLHDLTSEHGTDERGFVRIGDFSLNVTNAETAREVLGRGVHAFTPSFDLDAAQLLALLGDRDLAARAEVVLHHPMPLFHMEHCVYAALLSKGTDHTTCGRPCDRHALSLRDRANMDHPVIADVGCRNTVFHARAQSGATLARDLGRLGVGRYRIELVRETAEQTRELVTTYGALLAGKVSADTAWQTLRAEAHYGVVRGSLRILT
ncbi:MAG: U32 family peptidase [Polyangiaceae bacterium]